ncbi:MAG: DUF4013 domain-containing protein [Acidobacteria bacterium]|nr:DUF4013 domain-containing protein [Acidobacteriota bacterium]
MNLDQSNEMWQVEVGGQIYEAPLAELPEWIGEGSLQPNDKVRKGNLRWIEAQKVPSLVPFFNARANGEPMPVVQSMTVGSVNAEEPLQAAPIASEAPTASLPRQLSDGGSLAERHSTPGRSQNAAHPQAAMSGQCANHLDRQAAYLCKGCGLELCKACPSSYGGVRICPGCGGMCRSVAEAATHAKRAAVDSGIGSESFGFSDFGRAIAYPFKFKSSLFLGGLMFMIFTFGQSAASLGSLFLAAAAIFCFMLANMVVFGIRANLIDNFTQGNLDVDFMPSFDDFSIWDDVIQPFFLYIAANIASFGPFVLVVAVGTYLVLSSAAAEMQKFNRELTGVPGTQVYAPDRTAEQTKEVNEILNKVKQQNERRVADQQTAAASAETGQGAAVTETPGQVPDQQKLDELLQEIRTKQLQSAQPVQAEFDQAGYLAALQKIIRLAAPLVVFGFLTLLWGLFYYPAACAVAGYTRSFTATINPMVGLDTIRRLGGSYVLILLMGLIIGVMSLVIAGVVGMLFSPLDLPKVGNLPATIIGSFITFYFSVVFSCILGYALFKSRDKLKLAR